MSAVHPGVSRAARPATAILYGRVVIIFRPLVSDERVIAVISVAAIDDYRAFPSDDLALMQALASRPTIALERTRTSIELAEALQRERFLASIGRHLRTELDLQLHSPPPSPR